MSTPNAPQAKPDANRDRRRSPFAPPLPEESASPEEELLLCAGRQASDATLERLERLLSGPLHTARVLELARGHAMEPLLHQVLQLASPRAAPPDLFQPLRERRQHIAFQNLLLAGELRRLMEEFRRANAPVIPFKGPLLAIGAYGDLSLRRFLDLDLLVPPSDFPRTRALLADLGYRRSLAEPHEAAYVASLGQLPLIRDDGRSLVELHLDLGMPGFPYRVAFDELVSRLEPVTVGEQSLATLKAEDLILYLCVHGAKHHWNRLGWVCDIAVLLRTRTDLDWDHVAREARRLHCRRMLALGLYLPHALFEQELPSAFPPLHAEARSLAARIRRAMFLGRPPGAWEGTIFHLQARERWRDRAACALSFLANPTPADWTHSFLPSRWRWAHSALRPFRLTGKYAKGWLLGRLRT